MTDSCPHESIPLKTKQFRQWSRVVTRNVGLWYHQHSTPNPLGISPNCEIIKESKFNNDIKSSSSHIINNNQSFDCSI